MKAQTKMTAVEIIEAITSMTERELMELNNQYCGEYAYRDQGEIYDNDEDFYNTFFLNNPLELARAVHYGDYNLHHAYIKFDGYGNLETFDSISIDDLVDTLEVMAEQIADDFHRFDDLFDSYLS